MAMLRAKQGPCGEVEGAPVSLGRVRLGCLLGPGTGGPGPSSLPGLQPARARQPADSQAGPARRSSPTIMKETAEPQVIRRYATMAAAWVGRRPQSRWLTRPAQPEPAGPAEATPCRARRVTTLFLHISSWRIIHPPQSASHGLICCPLTTADSSSELGWRLKFCYCEQLVVVIFLKNGIQ